MFIKDHQLESVKRMVEDFAAKNRLTCWIESVVRGPNKLVTLISFAPNKYVLPKEYSVVWEEVPSLTAALTPIFADVLNHFGCATTKATGMLPEIKKVIFHDPATIVYWADGSKTVVKCQPGDIYSEETGLAMAISKKVLGNTGNFNEVFKKWVPTYERAKKPECEPVTLKLDNNVLAGIIDDIFQGKSLKSKRGAIV